jgi:hypothetical protein
LDDIPGTWSNQYEGLRVQGAKSGMGVARTSCG